MHDLYLLRALKVGGHKWNPRINRDLRLSSPMEVRSRADRPVMISVGKFIQCFFAAKWVTNASTALLYSL
jgi:hypothetical protein